VKGVHSPASDQSAKVPAEVIEVGSGFEAPVPELPAKRKRRSSLLRAGGLVALVIAGLALVPGNDTAPTTTQVDLTLQKPAIASSTIPVLPGVVSVVTDDRFPLIPVADLSGYTRLIGPVEFDGRFWVAGTPPWANYAVILSSQEGNRWAVESELVGPGEVLRIEDLAVFGSRLVVIGTSSNSRPTPQTDFAQTLLSWTSADGHSWFLQLLPELEGVAYWGVSAVPGSDQIMVMAGVYEVYGELIYPAIPERFDAALAAGQLVASGERRSDSLRVSVVAPPGLEVFSTEVPVSGDHLMYSTRLLRSDDLAVWTEVDPAVAAGWDLTWSEDVGFVPQGIYGGTMNSADGREWQSTDLPSASLLPWRDGLLALAGNDHLMFIDNGEETRIALPSEMIAGNTFPWLDVGPDRMIAAVTTYENQYTSPRQVFWGDLLLALSGNDLIVSEDVERSVRLALYASPPVLPVAYDPIADAVTIDPGDGEAPMTIPLEVLVVFWSGTQAARTNFFQSQDGLVWSKAESALLSSSVTLIGAIEDGFLIGMGGIEDLGVEEPLTVFRTGPID
jgi:hypothetical protein